MADVDVALPAVEVTVVEPVRPDAVVLTVIMAALSEKHPTTPIDEITDIYASGLADSQMFLDLILDIEGKTGLLFDAEAMDFDKVTPLGLAMAFKVP